MLLTTFYVLALLYLSVVFTGRCPTLARLYAFFGELPKHLSYSRFSTNILLTKNGAGSSRQHHNLYHSSFFTTQIFIRVRIQKAS